MDFIVGLPLTAPMFDSILMIVDRLTKSIHFRPINIMYELRSMLRSTLLMCYICTEFQR
jgi:hypothetical protein